jgi:hypothetical protein
VQGLLQPLDGRIRPLDEALAVRVPAAVGQQGGRLGTQVTPLRLALAVQLTVADAGHQGRVVLQRGVDAYLQRAHLRLQAPPLRRGRGHEVAQLELAQLAELDGDVVDGRHAGQAVDGDQGEARADAVQGRPRHQAERGLQQQHGGERERELLPQSQSHRHPHLCAQPRVATSPGDSAVQRPT